MQTSASVYLIKDLARLSGQSVHTIKFYLRLGLIQETGRSPQTRFRFFDDSTVARLSQIRAWRKQRKSLAEIRRLLAGNAERGTQNAERPLL
jgi:DNA-binding transcriptional MerR regulator